MSYASEQAMKDLESLMVAVLRYGDWLDAHDDILQRWRDSQGEAVLGGWTWWAKAISDEHYTSEGPTKADAVADLITSNPAVGPVQVCEARGYCDRIAQVMAKTTGVVWFARHEQRELLPTSKALDVARSSARFKPHPTKVR